MSSNTTGAEMEVCWSSRSSTQSWSTSNALRLLTPPAPEIVLLRQAEASQCPSITFDTPPAGERRLCYPFSKSFQHRQTARVKFPLSRYYRVGAFRTFSWSPACWHWSDRGMSSLPSRAAVRTSWPGGRCPFPTSLGRGLRWRTECLAQLNEGWRPRLGLFGW